MNIAMLVSGGVDSSVALKLLKDEGHDITAFYLKIWLEDEVAFLGECPWEEDLKYVRAVCEQLGVPLVVAPLQREYHDRVISYALNEIRAGRTPNPDVMCNSFVKFGAFLEWLDAYSHPLCPSTRRLAQDISPPTPSARGLATSPRAGEDGRGRRKEEGMFFDKVATGHYARVAQVTSDKGQETGGRMSNVKCQMSNTASLLTTHYSLLTSRDSVKDQTYFLSRLTPEQLSRACFPLGEYTKREVREMARQWNLPTKDRPDSQGLCFLGKINYRDFVKHHLGEREGDIVNAENSEMVARHKGHWFYTIGQRHGLDLSGGPWYVTGKDAKKNIVYISHRLKMTRVERDEFEVEDFTFLVSMPSVSSHPSVSQTRYLPSGRGESQMSNVFVKIRHGSQRYRCDVECLDDKKTRLRVKLLDAKERGIAPGQFAVLYDGEVCLGSGVISG